MQGFGVRVLAGALCKGSVQGLRAGLGAGALRKGCVQGSVQGFCARPLCAGAVCRGYVQVLNAGLCAGALRGNYVQGRCAEAPCKSWRKGFVQGLCHKRPRRHYNSNPPPASHRDTTGHSATAREKFYIKGTGKERTTTVSTLKPHMVVYISKELM